MFLSWLRWKGVGGETRAWLGCVSDIALLSLLTTNLPSANQLSIDYPLSLGLVSPLLTLYFLRSLTHGVSIVSWQERLLLARKGAGVMSLLFSWLLFINKCWLPLANFCLKAQVNWNTFLSLLYFKVYHTVTQQLCWYKQMKHVIYTLNCPGQPRSNDSSRANYKYVSFKCIYRRSPGNIITINLNKLP